MNVDPAARASLAAVVEHDVQAIRSMDTEIARLRSFLDIPEPEFRDRAAVAYLLHNIYNALESSFEQISRTFENHITQPAQWHRELMSKMFLDIPGVRPRVLPDGLRGLLNDLRGFRHLFRHGYDFQIDPVRLRALVERWNADKDALLAALEDFREYLLREVKS